MREASLFWIFLPELQIFVLLNHLKVSPIIKKPVNWFVIPVNWLVVIWVSRILVLNSVLHNSYFTSKIRSKILPLKFLMRRKLLHIPHISMTKWRKIYQCFEKSLENNGLTCSVNLFVSGDSIDSFYSVISRYQRYYGSVRELRIG